MNNLEIEKLRENEIAGAATINPVIDWIRNLCSTSDYLYFSNNAYGGINIDMDFNLLAGQILQMVERLAADFKATIDGSKLTVAGGHVFLPDKSYLLGTFTRNLTAGDDGKAVCLTTDASDSSSGAPSWEYEVLPLPQGIVSSSVVRLPLCVPFRDGGKWYVRHLHIGSYVLAVPPAPLIAGYNASRMQSLDHLAGGGLVWTDYGECIQ